MDSDLRKPSMAVLAVTLFSISTTVGQIDSNKARKTTASTSVVEIRRTSRPPVGERGPKISADLPFQRTVIIYYNAPEKRAPTSVDPRTDGAQQKKEAVKAIASNAGQKFGRGSGIRGKASAELQPLVIYYKTYRPQTFFRTPSRPFAEPKLKAETISNARTTEAFYPLNAEPTNLSSFAAIELRKPISEPNMSAVVASKAQINAVSSDRDVEKIIEASSVGSVTRENAETSMSEDSKRVPPAQNNGEATAAPNTSNAASTDLPTTQPESVSDSTPRDLLSDRNTPATIESESGAVSRESVSAEAMDFNNSGVQLALNHQYTEAEALLQRAIDTQPSVARFHRNLSILYEKMNLIDKALASARTAEQLSPSDPFIVEQRCLLELAAAEAASAVVCYEKLNSIRPLDELSRTYLGIAMFKTGKVDESIVLLEQAANSKPPLPAAINALGVAYYRKKRIKEAAAAFKRSVEAAPDVPESRYNLAIAQLSLRNREGAISQYNILKEGSPEHAARLYEVLFRDKLVVVPKN